MAIASSLSGYFLSLSLSAHTYMWHINNIVFCLKALTFFHLKHQKEAVKVHKIQTRCAHWKLDGSWKDSESVRENTKTIRKNETNKQKKKRTEERRDSKKTYRRT